MDLILLFFIEWLGLTILILDCMSRDNMHWITSSPEWNKYHKGKGPVKNYLPMDYIGYIFKDRIVKVWTDMRDIFPAIVSGFAVVCFINKLWLLGGFVIIAHWIFGAVYFKYASARSWEK